MPYKALLAGRAISQLDLGISIKNDKMVSVLSKFLDMSIELAIENLKEGGSPYGS